jgi:hypothetical protein
MKTLSKSWQFFKNTHTHFDIFSLQWVHPSKREGFAHLSKRRRVKMSALLRQKEEALTGPPHDSVPAACAGLPAGHRRQLREVLRLVSFFMHRRRILCTLQLSLDF